MISMYILSTLSKPDIRHPFILLTIPSLIGDTVPVPVAVVVVSFVGSMSLLIGSLGGLLLSIMV